MTTVINIEGVTSGSVDGTGSFDILAASMAKQLEREYDAGRIVGADYANAYIGILNSAMSQALHFELSKAQAGFSADLTAQNLTSATIAAEISLATKQDQIDLISNNKKLSDEKLEQEEFITTVEGIKEFIAVATKNAQVDILLNNKSLSDEQLAQATTQGDIADEQLTQIRVAGEIQDNQKEISADDANVSSSTVTSRISLAEEQLANIKAQTKVLLEKGGFR